MSDQFRILPGIGLMTRKLTYNAQSYEIRFQQSRTNTGTTLFFLDQFFQSNTEDTLMVTFHLAFEYDFSSLVTGLITVWGTPSNRTKHNEVFSSEQILVPAFHSSIIAAGFPIPFNRERKHSAISFQTGLRFNFTDYFSITVQGSTELWYSTGSASFDSFPLFIYYGFVPIRSPSTELEFLSDRMIYRSTDHFQRSYFELAFTIRHEGMK
jgi:hypothetical protein